MKLRLFLTILLAIVSTGVWADNLILIPRGSTLTTGQFHGQILFSSSKDQGNFFSFSSGLQQLELSYTHAEYADDRTEEIIGGQWNVLPETFITPAICVGVRDIGAQTKEGTGLYAAMTKHIPIQNYTRYVDDFSLTVGVGAKAMNGFFCGAEIKLPLYLVGQLEYDGDNWNSALCWQPVDTFRLKYYKIGYEPYYGVEFTPVEF